jgi:hypothetical protein
MPGQSRFCERRLDKGSDGEWMPVNTPDDQELRARTLHAYPVDTRKEMKMKKKDDATARVIEYALRYARNKGLKPMFPRLVVGMMRELDGWPVRNADGGSNIAQFNSADDADKAIAKARLAFKAAFGRSWSEF